MHELSLLWLLSVTFVLLSAAAGAEWLYGPDVSLMRAAQNWPSDFLGLIFRVLSLSGAWKYRGSPARARRGVVLGRTAEAGRTTTARVPGDRAPGVSAEAGLAGTTRTG